MDVAKFLAVQNFQVLNIPAYAKAGIVITVRAILDEERQKLVALTEAMKTADETTAANNLALMCAVFLGDDKGERVFQDGDISSIKTRIPLVIQKTIIQEGAKYNLLSKDSIDEEKKTLKTNVS